MKIGQQIEQQTSSQNRLITILKWQEYQISEQQNVQQMNNERTTNEQQMNTNKNVNNEINNILNNNIPCSQEKEIQEAIKKVNNLFNRRY